MAAITHNVLCVCMNSIEVYYLWETHGEMGKKFYLATSQSVAEIKLSIVDAVVKKSLIALIYVVPGSNNLGVEAFGSGT